MNSATFVSMSNMLKVPKMPPTSRVIEHGLLVGIGLVLMNAAITLESLEIITGMIGALAVCVMKNNASRKCQKDCPHSDSGCKIAPFVFQGEPKTQPACGGETSPRDAEFVQLKACVQAELNVLRAEFKLESWKNKADQAEEELGQLHAKIAALERDLSKQYPPQSWSDQDPQTRIDDLFVELTEAKLRAEEVEAELAQALTNMAELEHDVAEATSAQSKNEKAAQIHLEALSMDLIDANDQVAMDVASIIGSSE